MPRRAGRAAPSRLVFVVHENRGLNDHIRDVARRLAVAGYSAVAPDFLSPAGGTPADEDRARDDDRRSSTWPRPSPTAPRSIRWLASPAGGSRKVGDRRLLLGRRRW